MRKSLAVLVLTVALGLLTAGHGRAGHVEADPNKDYLVTPEAGPWMVLVATYTGPERASLAKQMAYKIRAELDLPAFYFPYVDPERQREKEALQRANEMAEKLMQESGAPPVRLRKWTMRVEEHYGVLIGGWADPNAAKAYLDAKIRTIEKPPALVSIHGAEPYDTAIQIVRDAQGRPLDEQGRPIVDPVAQRPKYERVRINPFARATVTRNPSIKQAPLAKQADPVLKKFNADEEYSLLNCPARCTFLVKEYIGATRVDEVKGTTVQDKPGGAFLSAIGIGGTKPGETLAAAAHDAHQLAEGLRKLHFDAYVLHGRSSSIVTIGGFTGPEDPAARRVARQFEEYLQANRKALIARGLEDKVKLIPSPPMVEIPRP